MAFKPKILVVEDDEQMLRLLGEVLAQMGAEPCCEGSSVRAAELAEREKYDGVFLDWKMPELDGLELAQRIRQSKMNPNCPIVMITGITEPGALKNSFQAGINFFLQKPVTIQQVRHLLNVTRGMMLEERRRYQRISVQTEIRCKWDDREVTGESLNLSVSGILVKFDQAPPRETEVHMEFKLPGDPRPFDIVARVARLTSDGHHAGLQFVEISPEQRQRLLDFSDRALGTFRPSEAQLARTAK